MNVDHQREVLRRNLRAVEERLRAACTRAGRKREEITLVAVTKAVSAETAALWPGLGVLDLGEGRPQELWHKAALLPAVRWHMVGHLQRNKVERTLPLTALCHSVDSARLAQAVDAEAMKAGRVAEVFLEVNVSREASKHGFAPEEMACLGDSINALKNVHISGLMTMAPEGVDARPTFAGLRELRDRLLREWGRPLPHLSMGMSDDFETAVEEGATHVRVGSVLHEGID